MTNAEFQAMEKRVLGRGTGPAPRDIAERDLLELGCSQRDARRFIGLLSREKELESRLGALESRGIHTLTRISPGYPRRLRRLGESAPMALFCLGDLEPLNQRGVTLVGSRELSREGAAFARKAGELAAKYGFVLISGGARGADSAAQEAALKAGGEVVSLLPGGLSLQARARDRLLLASCLWPGEGFSVDAALKRNRYLHALGEITLVAQSGVNSGGTWRGSVDNLAGRLSPLYVNDMAQGGGARLIEMGARPVSSDNLEDLFARLQSERA